MFAYIIKYYITFLCLIIIYFKINNYKFSKLLYNTFYFLVPLFQLCIAYCFKSIFTELTYCIPLLMFWILISILTQRPKITFISVMISFGISYSLNIVSSIIALIIIFPFYNEPSTFPYVLLSILTAIIHITLTIILLKFKRFSKGMPFLISTSFINTATIICLALFAYLIYTQSNFPNLTLRIITPFSCIIILSFLIHWWQAQITKSYKRSLEQRELESLRIELQEKDKTIAKLKAENVRLGDVTHEYNKLIPPLAEAVCEYLEGDFADAEMMRSKGQALSAQLRTQSEKLAQTTALVNAKKYQQHDSGIDNLNPYLNSFEKQAVSGNIEFSVHTAVNLKEQLPKNLSVDDFVHLVVNLLSNAFIAITDCANPVVQLQFYQVGKHFVIEVSDNGIPFEIESLLNFGLERITTHADTGGSGVGLVSIWEIKEACGATLHIEEYESNVPFSKKILLIFNKKNLYSLRSWRKEEILQKSKRIDLQVYDFEK